MYQLKFFTFGISFKIQNYFKDSLYQTCIPVLFHRQIRDTVNWIFSEQMMVYYINIFRDTFWPNGKLAPHNKTRSDDKRRKTKERAQQKLLDNIPGKTRFSFETCRLSTSFCFSVLKKKNVRIFVLPDDTHLPGFDELLPA